jgi:hypothetical protein
MASESKGGDGGGSIDLVGAGCPVWRVVGCATLRLVCSPDVDVLVSPLYACAHPRSHL